MSPGFPTPIDDLPRRGAFRGESAPWLCPVGYAPQPSYPVFLALYPDPEMAERIARLAWYLRDKHRLKGWPLGAPRFHVTLFGISQSAEVPRETIAAIGEAVARVRIPPFLVAFDRTMSFDIGEKNALVLVGDDGVAGLTMVRHDLVAALREAGLVRRKGRQFTPHVTLLYDECRVREQAVEEIRWTVREIVLVQSLYGQSRHIALGQWPLRGK